MASLAGRSGLSGTAFTISNSVVVELTAVKLPSDPGDFMASKLPETRSKMPYGLGDLIARGALFDFYHGIKSSDSR